MKRFLSALLAITVLVALSGCYFVTAPDKTENEEKTETIEKEFKKPESITKTKQDYIDQIDGEYQQKQQLEEYMSTYGMVSLADEYAGKWEDLAEQFYDKLKAVDGRVTLDGKEYSSKEFRKYITRLKNKRLKEIKQKKEQNLKELKEEYEGGTIIGPLASAYNYDLQMEWALELVDIYSAI